MAFPGSHVVLQHASLERTLQQEAREKRERSGTSETKKSRSKLNALLERFKPSIATQRRNEASGVGSTEVAGKSSTLSTGYRPLSARDQERSNES